MGSKLSSKSIQMDGDDHLNEKLPTELLEEIFGHLPPKDVIKCAHVCHRWANIVRNQRFWLKLCVDSGVSIPPPAMRADHEFDYQRIRVRRPFNRNLIVNGCGETGKFHPWKLTPEVMGNAAMIVEEPPVGCENTPTSTCFATSFRWSGKTQTFKLSDLGIDANLIKNGRLRVTASEEYTARFDCSGMYRLKLFLTNTTNDGVKGREVFIDRDSMDRQVWQSTCVAVNIPEKFPDNGSIIFFSEGKDGQFWAGNYGAKMYNAQLKIECNAWADEIGEEVGEIPNMGYEY